MVTHEFLEGLAKYCVETKKMTRMKIHDLAVKMPLFESATFQAILNDKYEMGACW